MKYFTTFSRKATLVVVCMISLLLSSASFAQTVQSVQANNPLRPNFGSASTYAVFTGSGIITNTGLSVLTGDIGTDAGSINGFPPGVYSGQKHIADGNTALAKADLLTAWTVESAVSCDFVLGAGIVDGQSFDPGVYCSGGATTATGNVTFDAHGDGNAIFIVKIGGQFDANIGTHILLANNARAANIYWFVDGATNIKDQSTFKGTIFARGAITFLGNASLDGRALVAPAGAINISANNMAISTDSASTNSLIVVRPAKGDTLRGGTQNYQITWSGTGIDAQKTIDFSLDSGKTWKLIATINSPAFVYNWNVPDTLAPKSFVRVTDKNNLTGKSGMFVILSSKPAPGTIIITKPALADTLIAKTQNYQIKWTGNGIATKKTFDYSLDGGLTWTLIGSLNADVFTFNWNVPDTVSNKAVVRITDANGAVGKSAIFVIKSSKPGQGSIVVISPAAGEVIQGGMQNYQIMWSGANIASSKTFEYSIDGGSTWVFIGNFSSDQFTYFWPSVPNVATTTALIRITDANGANGTSGMFTIVKTPGVGSIVVTHPITGEVIEGGTQNFDITWTGSDIATAKTFEYSLDGGSTWNLIGFLNADQFTYTWANVPNIATTQAVIRITDANGVTGSSGFFTITYTPGVGSINSITLTGLDSKRNIGNNKQLGISYTFTPDIGPTVEVEYSLDYTLTWGHIATLNTAETPNASWMTVPTGYYNPVFIRITSSTGKTRTSGPFSIGTSAGVTYTSQKDGYSLTNYPNPVNGKTNISFVLPVASNVSLIISDALGREVANILSERFEVGMHTVPFNSSNIAPGMYNYTLRAGSILLVGRMIVTK